MPLNVGGSLNQQTRLHEPYYGRTSFTQKTYRILNVARFVILIALLVINSLAIAGQLGSMSHLALYGTNMGLATVDAVLVYFNYPNQVGSQDLKKQKILHMITTLILTGVLNGLGVASIGPFSNVKAVAMTQLIATIVLHVISGQRLLEAAKKGRKELFSI